MSDVFISYSRLDKEFVGKMRDALAEREQDVWVDWESIPPSQAWWEEIKKGIAKANNFVVVLSANSIVSPTTSQHARNLNNIAYGQGAPRPLCHPIYHSQAKDL